MIPHRDDERKAVLFHILAVEPLKLGPLGIGEPVKPRARLLRHALGRQPPGGSKLAGEVRMRHQHAAPLPLGGAAKGAAKGVMHAQSAIMRRAKLERVGALGHPGRLLEHSPEPRHESLAIHLAGALVQGGRMGLRPMPGDVDAAGAPHPLMPLHMRDKSLQPGDPAGSPDKAAMQAHAHHFRRARTALGI